MRHAARPMRSGPASAAPPARPQAPRRSALHAAPFHVESFAQACAFHLPGEHKEHAARAWGSWESFSAKGVYADQRVLVGTLRHCEERRAIERTAEVEAKARSQQIPLDGPLYWVLLRSYGAASKSDDVARLTNEMDRTALLNDRHGLVAAIQANISLHRVDKAWAFFQRMRGDAIPGMHLAALLVRALVLEQASPAASNTSNDSYLPSLSEFGTHLSSVGYGEADIASVIVRGLDQAGVLPDEKLAFSAVSLALSEEVLCSALIRLHATHNDLEGAQQVVLSLRTRGKLIPSSLWEVLFRLFKARNVLPKALTAADEYVKQTGGLTSEMSLGLLELGVNYNAPDTVFAALAHVRGCNAQLSDALLRSTMRLLHRFGKREPARQLVRQVKSEYPAPAWRHLEAFLASENMTDLMPTA